MLLTVLGVGAQQLCGKLLRCDAQRLADLLSAVRLRMQHLVHQRQHLLQRGLQLCLNLGQLQQPAQVQTSCLGQHLSAHPTRQNIFISQLSQLTHIFKLH